MSGKRSRLIWIILGAIVLVVAALSVFNCANKGTSVDISYFKEIIATIGDNVENNNADAGTLTPDNVNALKNNNTIAQKIADTAARVGNNYTAVTFDTVLFDGYNLSFNASIVRTNGQTLKVAFRSIYGRTNMEEYENALDRAGIEYSYTDPNAGSIWGTLLPGGCLSCWTSTVPNPISDLQTPRSDDSY